MAHSHEWQRFGSRAKHEGRSLDRALDDWVVARKVLFGFSAQPAGLLMDFDPESPPERAKMRLKGLPSDAGGRPQPKRPYFARPSDFRVSSTFGRAATRAM